MEFMEFIRSEQGLQVARAGIIVLLGLLLAKITGVFVNRLASRYLEAQQSFLLRRLVFWGVMVIIAMSALHQLGFSLTVILGAAGIISVALGFAAQTSVSNLISGLFLIGEKPFAIGDVIVVGGTTGEVLSIDLLSVKLRTFDNLFVRVPNETLINSEIRNWSRFPIRRFDLMLRVAYKENIAHVRKVLARVADEFPYCLTEPKPMILFLGFGDSSLDFQFSVWTMRENWLDLRNGIPERIKEEFDAEGIEIPFPHRTLYTGSVTDPFPVRVVGDPAVSGGDNAPSQDAAPDPREP